MTMYDEFSNFLDPIDISRLEFNGLDLITCKQRQIHSFSSSQKRRSICIYF